MSEKVSESSISQTNLAAMAMAGQDLHPRRTSIAPESYLWAILGLILLVAHPQELSAWSAVVFFLYRSFWSVAALPDANNNNNNTQTQTRQRRRRRYLWRQPNVPDQGIAIILITSLYAVVRQSSIHHKTFAWVVPWVLAGRTWFGNGSLSLSSMDFALSLLGLWFHTAWQWYGTGKMLVAHFLYRTIGHAPALQGVWTADEWTLLTVLCSAVWLEWMRSMVLLRGGFSDSNWQGTDNLHSVVASAGNIGAVLASTFVATAHKSNTTCVVAMRVAVCVMAPLIVIEMSLLLIILPNRLNQITPLTTVNWLINFLSQVEQPLWNGGPVVWPRYLWVLYWAIVVGCGIMMAPDPGSERQSRIVARKWFHAVAVFLFTPVTVYAPMLQSLGYAVAVAVLVVLEGLRPQLPWLDRYYQRYLDTSKDSRATGTVVVSHIALILGCALPLWCLEVGSATIDVHPMVAVLGILVVGVGDGAGAVVGSRYGRHGWAWAAGCHPNNGRTLEGSAAMLASMLLSCVFLSNLIPVPWDNVIPTCIFCTALEAVTRHMDNLVLPMAAVAFFGLWPRCIARFLTVGNA